ncbi:MAG: hypothetical protein OXH93_01230, partial [Caldilineaceae bacterium]|nr:hypothetical protein [Caldilineaceae bacterium]
MLRHRQRRDHSSGYEPKASWAAAADTLASWLTEIKEVGPDELRYPATIYVWVRWFICAACVFQLVYRPVFTYFTYV